MRARLRRGFAGVAVIAIAITILAVSLAAPVVSTTEDFSIFNSGWNGTSDMGVLVYRLGKFAPSFQLRSSGADIEVTQLSLEELSLDPRTDAMLIIGPTKDFTQAEGNLIGDFVKGGGTLLLADDFGTGNTLLEGMNATSRFSGNLVMDLSFEKQPEFSVCFDIREDLLTKNVTTMLLNYPSTLSIDSGTTDAFAYSSVASWLDTSEDGMQQWGEPRGPFPILARERLGSGSIVLLSDPSVLINGMSEYMDNDQFKSDIINFMSTGRSSVYFDESHRDFFDPIAITMLFTGLISSNVKALVAASAFLLTLWIATDIIDKFVSWFYGMLKRGYGRILGVLGLRRRKPMGAQAVLSEEDLIRDISQAHPEWKLGLLRYIIRERERHRKFLDEKSS